ncbi:MAG TPA: RNA pseudouridine synthase [Clostridiales bacterium]|nr:RNA pseudouridine synthase [Clostridiales bacterium]
MKEQELYKDENINSYNTFLEDESDYTDETGPDPEDSIEEITIECTEDAPRLDVFLTSLPGEYSRAYIKKLIVEDKVRINGTVAKKAGMPVRKGQMITVLLEKPELLTASPQDIDLPVVYEDDDIIIVDKPRGMVVHPAPGNRDKTMVNALMFKYRDKLSDINGVLRPGIVHRIDKDTSGLLVVARNNAAHQNLALLFKKHDIKRVYTGICKGVLPVDKGIIKAAIGRHPGDRKKMAVVKTGGKEAVTRFQATERLDHYTVFDAELETGRTHQIRVHMAYIGHPIAGDDVYGGKDDFGIEPGQILHAKTLGFVHPGNGSYMEFHSELPEYFNMALQEIRERQKGL